MTRIAACWLLGLALAGVAVGVSGSSPGSASSGAQAAPRRVLAVVARGDAYRLVELDGRTLRPASARFVPIGAFVGVARRSPDGRLLARLGVRERRLLRRSWQ